MIFDKTFNLQIIHTLKMPRSNQCRIQQLFWGAGFSTSIVRRKIIVQLGSLGAGVLSALPSEVKGLFFLLNSSKHRSRGSATTNGDESLHQKSALLRVWRSESGIPNRYSSFRIALDTALPVVSIISYLLKSFGHQKTKRKS